MKAKNPKLLFIYGTAIISLAYGLNVDCQNAFDYFDYTFCVADFLWSHNFQIGYALKLAFMLR